MTQTLRWARIWTVLRVAAAVAIAVAVIAQAERTIGGAIEGGRDVVTTTANFFSFFTILSNVLSVVVLVWAAVWFWRRGKDAADPEPPPLAVALAAVTSYMIVTGIVYNTLLRGIPLPQGTTVPWSNEILHVVGPVFFLADLFLGPRRRALSWRALFAILAFPIVWVVYTLVRGPLVTNPVTGDPWWYPYPFLDPASFDNGYAGVAVYVVGIAAAITAAAAVVVWVGRRRGTASPSDEPASEARAVVR